MCVAAIYTLCPALYYCYYIIYPHCRRNRTYNFTIVVKSSCCDGVFQTSAGVFNIPLIIVMILYVDKAVAVCPTTAHNSVHCSLQIVVYCVYEWISVLQWYGGKDMWKKHHSHTHFTCHNSYTMCHICFVLLV